MCGQILFDPGDEQGHLLNSLTSSLVFQGYLSVMNSDGLGSRRLLAQYILDSWTKEERPLTKITAVKCAQYVVNIRWFGPTC